MIEIELNNEQTTHKIDKKRLIKAAQAILKGEGVTSASISLAVVDDPTIHDLNRRFLQHDYPTDVLSFVLDRTDDHLEGEVIVSADTAAELSAEYDWSPTDELLLYVIHGMLHLVGFDDKSPTKRRAMRAKEREYLAHFDLEPHYPDEPDSTPKKKATEKKTTAKKKKAR